MTHPLPPTPLWNDPQETSIHVWWDAPPSDVINQILQIREFPKPWDQCREIQISTRNNNTGKHNEIQVHSLAPTSTFEFRLIYEWSDGTRSGPGPAISADTAAAGCTPKNETKKKVCLIQ